MMAATFTARDNALRNARNVAANSPVRRTRPARSRDRAAAAHASRGLRVRRHDDHSRQRAPARMGCAGSRVVGAILAVGWGGRTRTLSTAAHRAARSGVEREWRLGTLVSP